MTANPRKDTEMKPRLLREKYLTSEGAHKRAGFERAVAPGEYARGEKARLYSYRVVFHENCYRVERFLPNPAKGN
jgi:hypothetical protein